MADRGSWKATYFHRGFETFLAIPLKLFIGNVALGYIQKCVSSIRKRRKNPFHPQYNHLFGILHIEDREIVEELHYD